MAEERQRIVERLHDVHIDGAADPRHAQLQPEDEVQFGIVEPFAGVGVLCHGETLSADTEHEPAEHGEIIAFGIRATGEQHLADEDEHREDYRAQTDAEDAIEEKSTDEAQDDVRPAVPGIEIHIMGGVDIQVGHHLLLESDGIVVAEIAPETEKADQYENEIPMETTFRVARQRAATTWIGNKYEGEIL